MKIVKSKIRKELKQTTRALLQIISGCPDSLFNKSPHVNAWSVGQVGEHLIKAETSVVRLFTGKAAPTKRNPTKKVKRIKNRMANQDVPMSATLQIKPDDSPKDKQAVLEKLQDLRQRLTGLIEVDDLTVLLADFDHPVFGALTRVEWIYFVIYHSKRHQQQMIEIQQQLNSAE